MQQRLKFKIAAYILAFVLAVSLLAVWLWFASGWQRDCQRLGDLKLIQTAMSDYFLQNGTYALTDCPKGALIGDCLAKVGAKNIKDPLSQDVYRYVVGSLGEDFFEINFAFESGLNDLPAGRYILTKDGVKK